MTKRCIDCTYHTRTVYSYSGRGQVYCHHPNNLEMSTGEGKLAEPFRDDGTNWKCGLRAQYFVPIPTRARQRRWWAQLFGLR